MFCCYTESKKKRVKIHKSKKYRKNLPLVRNSHLRVPFGTVQFVLHCSKSLTGFVEKPPLLTKYGISAEVQETTALLIWDFANWNIEGVSPLFTRPAEWK